MTLFAAPPVPPAVDPTRQRVTAQWKHPSPLIGARIDPQGRYVFAGAQDNAIVRWEMPGGKKVLYSGHQSWVRAIAFAAKERLLFSADWAGEVRAWPIDGDKPDPVWRQSAHRGWARALAVSPDGTLLASCGNDHLVKLWSVPDGKPLAALAGHSCHVYNVAFHPDGRHLVSADLKGVVQVWDVKKEVVTRSMDAKVLYKYDPSFMADIGGVRGMAIDAHGKYLACAGITDVTNAFAGVGNPLVVLFDWATGKEKLRLKPKAAFQGTAWGVAFHPDGFLLGVGGGNGGVLWAWNLESPQAFVQLALANNARDIALHPDGRQVAVPCYDGVLRVYELGKKKA